MVFDPALASSFVVQTLLREAKARRPQIQRLFEVGVPFASPSCQINACQQSSAPVFSTLQCKDDTYVFCRMQMQNQIQDV